MRLPAPKNMEKSMRAVMVTRPLEVLRVLFIVFCGVVGPSGPYV